MSAFGTSVCDGLLAVTHHNAGWDAALIAAIGTHRVARLGGRTPGRVAHTVFDAEVETLPHLFRRVYILEVLYTQGDKPARR